MKKFNFADFHKHGTKFAMVHARFNITNGIKLEVTDQSVSIRSGVCAASGCDFIGNGSSCSTKNFYEVSGFPVVNDLFMPSKCGLFVYCLLENLEQVKERIVCHLINSLNDYRNEQLKALDTIKISIDDFS